MPTASVLDKAYKKARRKTRKPTIRAKHKTTAKPHKKRAPAPLQPLSRSNIYNNILNNNKTTGTITHNKSIDIPSKWVDRLTLTHEQKEITPFMSQDIALLAEKLKRLGFQRACQAIGVSHKGMRLYLQSHPTELQRIEASRAMYVEDRVRDLENPGNDKGANALVQGASKVLAAMDKRYRPSLQMKVEGGIEHTIKHCLPAVDLSQYQAIPSAQATQIATDDDIIEAETTDTDPLLLPMPAPSDPSAPSGVTP